MLEGTKKLFPTDYQLFKDKMIEAANKQSLPIVLAMTEDKNFTLNDFKEMFMEFKKDTGLQISSHLFVCDICDKLHVSIEIDYPDVDEDIMVQ